MTRCHGRVGSQEVELWTELDELKTGMVGLGVSWIHSFSLKQQKVAELHRTKSWKHTYLPKSVILVSVLRSLCIIELVPIAISAPVLAVPTVYTILLKHSMGRPSPYIPSTYPRSSPPPPLVMVHSRKHSDSPPPVQHCWRLI